MTSINIPELRRRLMIERIELKKLLSDLGVPRPDDEYNLDPVADEEFDVDRAEAGEVAASLEDFALRADAEMTLEKRYRDVHAALLAIDAGSYGMCVECDAPIAVLRLVANPASLYCTAHMEDDYSTSAL